MNDATNLGDFYVKYFLKICLLKCFIVINFTVMKVVSGFFFQVDINGEPGKLTHWLAFMIRKATISNQLKEK